MTSLQKNYVIVVLLRCLHGLITAYFLSCIGWIYYSGLTNTPNMMAYLAAASIALEGVVVVLNHGDCPLGKVHHHYGDEQAFFELLLPKAAAKRAVPVLGLVSMVGFILLFL